jgi:hypothetical protein
VILSSASSFNDAYAATFDLDIPLILTSSDIFNEWEVIGNNANDTALDVLTDGSNSTYVKSNINDALQGFSFESGHFANAKQINYIEIFAFGKNLDTTDKPTKYSIGVAKETDARAIPNGGEEVGSEWEIRQKLLPTDTFSAKNVKAQKSWTTDVLNQTQFTDGDDLLFIIEQNTAAKDIGVSEFWVIVNASFEISITMNQPIPTTPYWGTAVLINGTSVGVDGTNLKVLVDFGDNSTKFANLDGDGNWDITHSYDDPGDYTITAFVVDTTNNNTPLPGVETPQESVFVQKRPSNFDLINNITNDPEIYWGDLITKEGYLLDSLSGTGIGGANVEISGSGLSILSVLGTTNSTGGFSETIQSTLQHNPNAEIITNFTGNSHYLNATNPNFDTFSTLKHPTKLNIENINSVDAGTEITIVGNLTDLHTGDGAPNAVIQYNVYIWH